MKTLEERVREENPTCNFSLCYKDRLNYKGQLADGTKFIIKAWEYRYEFTPQESALDLVNCDYWSVEECE